MTCYALNKKNPNLEKYNCQNIVAVVTASSAAVNNDVCTKLIFFESY